MLNLVCPTTSIVSTVPSTEFRADLVEPSGSTSQSIRIPSYIIKTTTASQVLRTKYAESISCGLLRTISTTALETGRCASFFNWISGPKPVQPDGYLKGREGRPGWRCGRCGPISNQVQDINQMVVMPYRDGRTAQTEN
jgi:hypothetical protein